MSSVAVHINRGEYLFRCAVSIGNELFEVLREVLGCQHLRVALRTGEAHADLALADKRCAVGLQHRNAVLGSVRLADLWLFALLQLHDFLALEERATRCVTGVNDADDSPGTGVLLAAELGIPRAVLTAEIEGVQAGVVVRCVFDVGGNHAHVRILGELNCLVRGQLRAEAVERGSVGAVDLHALFGGYSLLLLLKVILVLLKILFAAELLALLRLGGRDTGDAAVVRCRRLLIEHNDVAAVRVVAGIHILDRLDLLGSSRTSRCCNGGNRCHGTENQREAKYESCSSTQTTCPGIPVLGVFHARLPFIEKATGLSRTESSWMWGLCPESQPRLT